MKKYIILLIAILVLIAGCSKGYTGSATKNLEEKSTVTQNEEPIEIGNKKGNRAIDFTVVTTDGKTVGLQDYVYNKKPLLLYFWASWCPFCAKDFATVRNVYPQYKEDVEFLAVDLDLSESKELIENYKKSRGLNDIDFALGNQKILIGYGIRATTTKFAISRNGVILWTGSGAVDENTWRIILEGLKKN